MDIVSQAWCRESRIAELEGEVDALLDIKEELEAENAKLKIEYDELKYHRDMHFAYKEEASQLRQALEVIADTTITDSEQVNHLSLKHVVLYAKQALSKKGVE